MRNYTETKSSCQKVCPKRNCSLLGTVWLLGILSRHCSCFHHLLPCIKNENIASQMQDAQSDAKNAKGLHVQKNSYSHALEPRKSCPNAGNAIKLLHGWSGKWLNEAAAGSVCRWRVGGEWFIVKRRSGWDAEVRKGLRRGKVQMYKFCCYRRSRCPRRRMERQMIKYKSQRDYLSSSVCRWWWWWWAVFRSYIQ